MLRTKRLSFADAAVSVANQNEVGRDPADAQHASCMCRLDRLVSYKASFSCTDGANSFLRAISHHTSGFRVLGGWKQGAVVLTSVIRAADII